MRMRTRTRTRHSGCEVAGRPSTGAHRRVLRHGRDGGQGGRGRGRRAAAVVRGRVARLGARRGQQSSALGKRLLEVVDDVVDVLDAHRDTQQVLANAAGKLRTTEDTLTFR